MGSGPEPYIRSGIKAAFPALEDSEVLISSLNEEDLREVPYADATVATLWITAYAVSKFQNTRRKFYMIQDFEPIFYPAGTLSALSDATYRLGFYGLCNTLTLRDIYQNEYGGKAHGFDPAVDTALFRPPEGPRHQDDTMTVFLYGRPGTWRNCYELAVATIRRLKQRMKKKVRVVSAGSWVPAGDSESAHLIDNLGLLDYRETAALYKTCDVGLTFSMSKHPSYLPLELMASGALVVSNVNRYGSWLLKDGENCIIAEPTAESLCDALVTALTDDALRARLTANAVADIQANRSDWPTKIDGVYAYMCDPEGL
jgi:glycosyltransferase involved in cell wall biosynthesis